VFAAALVSLHGKIKYTSQLSNIKFFKLKKLYQPITKLLIVTDTNMSSNNVAKS